MGAERGSPFDRRAMYSKLHVSVFKSQISLTVCTALIIGTALVMGTALVTGTAGFPLLGPHPSTYSELYIRPLFQRNHVAR